MIGLFSALASRARGKGMALRPFVRSRYEPDPTLGFEETLSIERRDPAQGRDAGDDWGGVTTPATEGSPIFERDAPAQRSPQSREAQVSPTTSMTELGRRRRATMPSDEQEHPPAGDSLPAPASTFRPPGPSVGAEGTSRDDESAGSVAQSDSVDVPIRVPEPGPSTVDVARASLVSPAIEEAHAVTPGTRFVDRSDIGQRPVADLSPERRAVAAPMRRTQEPGGAVRSLSTAPARLLPEATGPDSPLRSAASEASKPAVTLLAKEALAETGNDRVSASSTPASARTLAPPPETFQPMPALALGSLRAGTAAPAAPPPITIRIGRIEVQVVAAPARLLAGPRPAPTVSLDAYLRKLDEQGS